MSEVIVAQAVVTIVLGVVFSVVIGMLCVMLPLREEQDEPASPSMKPKVERRKKAYKVPDFEYASKGPEERGLIIDPMNIVENEDNTRTGTTQTPAETERLG